MNCKDIDAARRLIAQFEGRALGRHNSGQDLRVNEVAEAERPPAPPAPSGATPMAAARLVGRRIDMMIVDDPFAEEIGVAAVNANRWFREELARTARVVIRAEWHLCAVGEHCESIHGADPRSDLRWRVPIIAPLPRIAWEDGAPEVTERSFNCWEFEATRIIGYGGIRYVWKRVR